MKKEEIIKYREKSENHLVIELLPFWTSRFEDRIIGGFITHFDEKRKDSGEDEKSIIAQTRSIYTVYF